MLISLHEDGMDILRGALLQLLLQITTPMLVFAQAKNFSLESFKLDVVEAGML